VIATRNDLARVINLELVPLLLFRDGTRLKHLCEVSASGRHNRLEARHDRRVEYLLLDMLGRFESVSLAVVAESCVTKTFNREWIKHRLRLGY
jgi:hypothetical protein